MIKLAPSLVPEYKGCMQVLFAFKIQIQGPNTQFSLGCNNLIKQQKAHLLSSAADLIYLLNWGTTVKEVQPIQKQLFVELDITEKAIYTYLQKEGKQHLDSIALQCSLPIFKTSSTLLNMEMKGVIRPLPGKLFEAI